MTGTGVQTFSWHLLMMMMCADIKKCEVCRHKEMCRHNQSVGMLVKFDYSFCICISISMLSLSCNL